MSHSSRFSICMIRVCHRKYVSYAATGYGDVPGHRTKLFVSYKFVYVKVMDSCQTSSNFQFRRGVVQKLLHILYVYSLYEDTYTRARVRN